MRRCTPDATWARRLLPRPLLLGLLAAGCGASFEAVYEGDVRFEHCYRLDRDPRIASSHREYCWNQWVQMYTYGQSQDRVEYARRRIRVLRGEPPPGLDPSEPEATAPQAVDPPSPEPQPAESVSSDPVSPVAGDPAPAASAALPQASCAKDCSAALLQCRKGCQTAPKGCAPCEPDYSACMRACYE